MSAKSLTNDSRSVEVPSGVLDFEVFLRAGHAMPQKDSQPLARNDAKPYLKTVVIRDQMRMH